MKGYFFLEDDNPVYAGCLEAQEVLLSTPSSTCQQKEKCGQNGPRVGAGEPLYTSFHTHQKTADRATRMHAPSHHQWHHQHLEPDSSRQQMRKTNVAIPQTCSLLYTVTFNQSFTRRVWSPWHYGASIMCYAFAAAFRSLKVCYKCVWNEAVCLRCSMCPHKHSHSPSMFGC